MPAGSIERTNARKEEIINACEKLYQTMSFKDITLKEIGKETSFSRTSIYNYFQTKEEIFLALLKREYDAWIRELCEAMESKETMTDDEIADVLARTLDNHRQLLKIMSMNHYDLEENSRMELLVEFKVSYGNAMKTVMAMLAKFRKDMDIEKRQEFVYSFFPFMFGIYPYTVVTEKQKEAMELGCLKIKRKAMDKMKVLMLNGSHRPNGNTFAALTEIEYEIFQLGAAAVRDCIGCGKCADNRCIFKDDTVNDFIEKAKHSDGFVFGTPVYYAHPSGRILSFLDRAFYAGGDVFKFKPGASVTVARRGGSSAAFDCLNKYFGIAQMPMPGSSYWNIVYGRNIGEAGQDTEGMQTMYNLAQNMAWMLKCFDLGRKNGVELPDSSTEVRMNFIR